ncbi:MAG: GNAT family N-acetyltransferase [Sandaracinaceae bacterium]|nr:GNAT family N-acetyltransferase [Sandaracinaceae bacterium]
MRESSAASPAAPEEVTLRPLNENDLDAVVALDARSTGLSRRPYFERRRASALRVPGQHLQLAAIRGDTLVGWVLARIAGGEFGRPATVVVLEALGVEPAAQRSGIARRILRRLEELAVARQASAIVTQVDWRNQSMLRFLDASGFTLAKRHVLARGVGRMDERHDDDLEHGQIVIRALRATDRDALVRIDAENTGTPRPHYFDRKLDEALHESAIAVSLVGESDGFPVAFAMARVDLGDFGRLGSVASLDTIGVSPRFALHGYGAALLRQMVDNLAALRVDSLETEVARDAFGLLGFLYRAGFDPSPRMAFERRLTTR